MTVMRNTTAWKRCKPSRGRSQGSVSRPGTTSRMIIFLRGSPRIPQILFSTLAEGRGTTRGRESQVPCILESLGIPFSGSDSTAIAITLDKWLTHHVLAGGGVPVPDLFMFSSDADLGEAIRLFEKHGTYIVKPRWEGSSKGVFPDSVVDNPVDLAKRVRRIWRNYRQPALVEEFLPGSEITVGVMGNRNPAVIGMMAIESEGGKRDRAGLFPRITRGTGRRRSATWGQRALTPRSVRK